MKKRKILYLFPLAALVLSGCTFQEGLETAKNWTKEKVYSPVVAFFKDLLGLEDKKEEKKEDEKPTPSPEGEGEGEGEGGGEQEGPQTEHAGTQADPYSGADAVLVANSLEADQATEQSYYIKGVVTQFEEQFNESFGNYSFTIEGGFIAWRLKNGSSFQKFSEGDIEVGDTVLMYAQIQNFKGEKPETKGGYVVSVEKPAIDAKLVEIKLTGTPKSEYIVGNQYNHDGLVVTAVYDNGQEQIVTSAAEWTYSKEVAEIGDTSVTITATYQGLSKSVTVDVTVIEALNYGSLENPLTIEEAIAVINKESPTSETLYVTGEVKSNKAYSTKYNNTEIWITDGEHDFELYGCSLPEGFTPAQPVENDPALVGKVVVAHGTAKKYNTTYELDKGCAIDSVSEPAPIVVESVVLSEETLALEVGEQAALSATVNPAKASQEVTWTVDNGNSPVEIVSFENGKVVALAAGTAVVTATSVADPTKSASCEVTVTEATKELLSLAFSGTPTKTEYVEGDEYDPAGLKVMAHYSVGEDEDVTANATIVPNKQYAEYGDTEVTFGASYGSLNISQSFAVTVSIKKGTESHPYSVAEARAAIDANEGITDVYVTGIVTSIPYAYSTSNKNMSFFFSDDGTKTNEIEAYKLSAETDPNVEVGDSVVVKGNLTKYNSTYELNTGCTLASLTKATVSSVTISGTPQTEYAAGASYNHAGLIATAHLNTGVDRVVTNDATWEISKETAELGDTEISITATYNNVKSEALVVNVTVTSDGPVTPTYYDATMAKGTDAYDDGTVNGKPCIKIGTSKKGGTMTITVPAGAVELKVYACAWNGVSNLSLGITSDKTGVTTNPTALALTADSGASNNSPFTIADESVHLFTITLTGVTEQTVLTFTTSAAKRAIVWGAQYTL